jgi:hypothetical protein
LKKIVGTFKKFMDSIFLYPFFGKKDNLKFLKKELLIF